MKSVLCMSLLLVALITTGCRDRERPETAAYRREAEHTQILNNHLRNETRSVGAMLHITGMVLVITGCGLGAALFVLKRTTRRS